MDYFDFESEIENIDKVLSTLDVNDTKSTNNIEKLNTEKNTLFKKIYSNLNPWQKVQISRHSKRPHTSYYIDKILVIKNMLMIMQL